jgi:hypothetical protein
MVSVRTVVATTLEISLTSKEVGATDIQSGWPCVAITFDTVWIPY